MLSDSYDYMIGPTRVVCNPLGYTPGSHLINPGFIDNLNIEVP